MTDSQELAALRELADDLFGSLTGDNLNQPHQVLPYVGDDWKLLSDAGLTLLTTPEAAGGSGAGATESAVILDRVGFHALPAPLAENDILAGWLLAEAGIETGDQPATAATVDVPLEQFRADGATLTHVPWAQVAHLVVIAGADFVATARINQPGVGATVEPVGDLAGEYRAHIRLTSADLAQTAASADLRAEFIHRGAWARAEQICGALDKALDLAVAHVTERTQFGRPIAKFQAVQELIAQSAAALTLAKASAAHATSEIDAHGFDSRVAQTTIAIAKIHAGDAAVTVSRNVHQAHGAIGFTLDHQLRHFTTRALQWDRDHGMADTWRTELGRRLLTSGSSVWEFVTQL